MTNPKLTENQNHSKTATHYRMETIHVVPYRKGMEDFVDTDDGTLYFKVSDNRPYDVALEDGNYVRVSPHWNDILLLTRSDGTRYPMRKAEFEAMGWIEGTPQKGCGYCND